VILRGAEDGRRGPCTDAAEAGGLCEGARRRRAPAPQGALRSPADRNRSGPLFELLLLFSLSPPFLSWAVVLVDLSGTLVFVKVRAPMRVSCLDLVFYRSKRRALR
jgi:hypothetical protein